MKRLPEGIAQYANNLEALREFVEVLAPVLQERSRSGIEQSRSAIADFTNVINSIGLLDDGEFDSDLVAQSNELKQIMPVVASTTKRLGNSIFHQQLLYRVSLITLVSTAEWFVSELLHEYFELYPNALDLDKRSLSFKDLGEFESVQGAREYLVEKEIEGFLRGSIEDWIMLLQKRCNLSMAYLDQEVRNQLIETSQRRNILSHNGGKVNSLYRKRVAKHLRWQGPGDMVKVPEEYLSERIGTFERAFILMGAELWKKLDPLDEKRYDTLFEITWRHLQAERWEIARGLAEFTMKDKKLSEISQLTQRFNYWQCQKWLGCFDEVEIEIKEADLSAKAPRFRLGQLALLDDDKEFVVLAKKLID